MNMKCLPSNIGLTDNGLATQLERYNELDH